MESKAHTTTLLQELWAIALARATDILQVKDGQLQIRDTGELTPDQCAAIASMEKSTTGIKVKFYDKLKALELLGKSMGVFDSKPEDTPRQDNLLRAILEATNQEVDHALWEIQSPPAAGDDLVEQTGSERP